MPQSKWCVKLQNIMAVNAKTFAGDLKMYCRETEADMCS